MRWMKVWVSLLGFLAAVPTAAQEREPGTELLVIGALSVEGLGEEAQAATLRVATSDLGSLGVRVAPESGQKAIIAKDCFDSPGCLRGTCSSLVVTGALDLQVIRAGPMVQLIARFYDCESGERLTDSESSAPAENFPQPGVFTAVFSTGVNALRGEKKTAQETIDPVPDTRTAMTERTTSEAKEMSGKVKENAKVADPITEGPDVSASVESKGIEPKIVPEVPGLLTKVEKTTPVRSAGRTWGWSLLGVGGGLLVGAGVSGVWALSLDSDLKRDCFGGICDPSQQEKIDRMANLSLAADVMLGIGVASVVAGVILLTVFDPDEEAGSAGIRVAPSAAPGFTGAVLEGRF